jgi:hypothetical protein
MATPSTGRPSGRFFVGRADDQSSPSLRCRVDVVEACGFSQGDETRSEPLDGRRERNRQPRGCEERHGDEHPENRQSTLEDRSHEKTASPLPST